MTKAALRDKGITIAAGWLATFFILWCQFTETHWVQTLVQKLEYLAYDYRLNATLQYGHHEKGPIAIVDIDERSLKQEGRWPWPRKKIAKLTKSLMDQGATVIAFDVLFSEPQLNMAEEVFQQLNNESSHIPNQEKILHFFDDDAALAETLSEGEVVLGYVLHNEKSDPIGELGSPIQVLDPKQAARLTVATTQNYTGNLSILQKAARSGGFITASRDQDGVIRRAPLVIRHGDSLYPSLSLEAARLYLLAEKISIQTEKVGDLDQMESVAFDQNILIPTDPRGRVLVPFLGKRETFPYFSATDVLQGKIDRSSIEGKILLVGTSALGLSDLQSTVVESIFPGVEIHANVISGLLEQKFPYEPGWAVGANFVLILLSGLILSCWFAFVGPIAIVVLGLVWSALEVAFNVWIWNQEGLVLAVVLPVILVLLLVAINTAYGFLFENRRKRQIKEMFGQYVSQEHVDAMSEDPESYTFEGESRMMSVLFADIRGFTTLSEKLTASALKDLLNRYFEPMTEIIFNHRGTIDKYVGDMIMAFWGAPRTDPEQAKNAIQAALDMLKKTESLGLEFQSMGLPCIQIGVGINTGTMNVGDMGSKYRRAYTVLGDSVNLGSRLEASTKFYGVGLIVGSLTQEQAPEFLYRKLDNVKVKGKKEAVAIHQPLCLKTEAPPELVQELDRHHTGLSHYIRQEWDSAETIYRALVSEHPSVQLYQMYLDRIQHLREMPPGSDWDGSFTRTEK